MIIVKGIYAKHLEPLGHLGWLRRPFLWAHDPDHALLILAKSGGEPARRLPAVATVVVVTTQCSQAVTSGGLGLSPGDDPKDQGQPPARHTPPSFFFQDLALDQLTRRNVSRVSATVPGWTPPSDPAFGSFADANTGWLPLATKLGGAPVGKISLQLCQLGENEEGQPRRWVAFHSGRRNLKKWILELAQGPATWAISPPVLELERGLLSFSSNALRDLAQRWSQLGGNPRAGSGFDPNQTPWRDANASTRKAWEQIVALQAHAMGLGSHWLEANLRSLVSAPATQLLPLINKQGDQLFDFNGPLQTIEPLQEAADRLLRP